MNNSVEYISSTRGKAKACNNGYRYYFDKKSKTDSSVEFYICEDYRKTNCAARIHVKNDVIIARCKAHNHEPRGTGRTSINMSSAVVTQITTSAPKQATPLSSSVGPSLSHTDKCDNVRTMVKRERPKKTDLRNQPDSPYNLVIPQQFSHFRGGEPFLLHDSGPGEDRILAFSTAKLLRFLGSSSEWILDGTYGVSTTNFRQLLTIHASSTLCTIPVVYAILSAKNEYCYSLLFGALKQLQIGLSPVTIACECEKSLQNAARVHFPEVHITGSFFHLSQAFLCKIQSFGYASLYYETEGGFDVWVRCMLSLAYVPVDDVVTSFETLNEDENFQRIVGEKAQDLVDHFEDTWIGRPRSRGRDRRDPIYPIAFWNVRERTIRGLEQTDVVTEWNQRANQLMGSSNILSLIEMLKINSKMSLDVLEQIVDDVEPSKKCAKFADGSDSFLKIVTDYSECNIVDYLREISTRMTL